MAASHDQKLIGGWSGGDGFGRHHLPCPQGYFAPVFVGCLALALVLLSLLVVALLPLGP